MTNENKPQAPLVDGYEVVIGIEIHCQLNTNTKIFSSASTLFGQEPNTQANIVDLAMPGALPVLNKDVVEKAVMFGLGVNAEIGMMNAFDRKNYFIPTCQKATKSAKWRTRLSVQAISTSWSMKVKKTNIPNVFTLPVLT